MSQTKKPIAVRAHIQPAAPKRFVSSVLRLEADEEFEALPPSFLRVDMPVPDIPAFACTPFLPTFTEAPRPPMVVLKPDLLTLRRTPGAIFIRF